MATVLKSTWVFLNTTNISQLTTNTNTTKYNEHFTLWQNDPVVLSERIQIGWRHSGQVSLKRNNTMIHISTKIALLLPVFKISQTNYNNITLDGQKTFWKQQVFFKI